MAVRRPGISKLQRTRDGGFVVDCSVNVGYRAGAPTYAEIAAWVRARYGFVPQTCWIAHCRELNGLPLRKAPNRTGARQKPCPADKRGAIEHAFRHFGLIDDRQASKPDR